MKKYKKILIIVQRSNGDVFLSATLIQKIFDFYTSPKIDLLVNDDTLQIAKLIPYVNQIHTFSYKKKSTNRWSQEKKIFLRLFNQYDLSINLTSSDRSVLYSLIAGKKTISVVEKNNKKSWWKKKLLSHFYYYDKNKHIIIQNLTPLSFLGIQSDQVQPSLDISDDVLKNVQAKLTNMNINEFLIFHPSAQYSYKILPKHLRDKLISSLASLNVPILITGSSSKVDLGIKNELPSINNVFDFIGDTSLEEYLALSKLSLAYIGMDTLNMHIAASQDKRIFTIFGPTNLKMWSPWSNKLKASARHDSPMQTYNNITIFQANMSCVACGKAGCDDSGKSKCLDNIDPDKVFIQIEKWFKDVKL